MKIVFMGTPDFSVPCLEALIEAGHEVALVVTQADKPKGRGHKLTPPPVKECALSHGIAVFQPEKMKDDAAFERLLAINADLFVVVAYGKILPKRILDLPKHGCINVHASLLPKFRGAAPIQWSIIAGETVTGVTTMQMDVGLDTGDMLLKQEVVIDDSDTGETLHDKLSLAGKEVLIKTLQALTAGTLCPQKQDDALSCYAPMIDKTTAKLDFNQPCEDVWRLVRAMNSYPYAHTTYNDKLMKIVDAKPEKGSAFTGNNGEIVCVKEDCFTVKCADGVLHITAIQMEGKKKMTVFEYLKGNEIAVGVQLR